MKKFFPFFVTGEEEGEEVEEEKKRKKSKNPAFSEKKRQVTTRIRPQKREKNRFFLFANTGESSKECYNDRAEKPDLFTGYNRLTVYRAAPAFRGITVLGEGKDSRWLRFNKQRRNAGPHSRASTIGGDIASGRSN